MAAVDATGGRARELHQPGFHHPAYRDYRPTIDDGRCRLGEPVSSAILQMSEQAQENVQDRPRDNQEKVHASDAESDAGDGVRSEQTLPDALVGQQVYILWAVPSDVRDNGRGITTEHNVLWFRRAARHARCNGHGMA